VNVCAIRLSNKTQKGKTALIKRLTIDAKANMAAALRTFSIYKAKEVYSLPFVLPTHSHRPARRATQPSGAAR